MLYLPTSINCNILLIGKTGTGKSSFANYLFETDRFTTGSGEPVTGWEDNFQYYHFYVTNISINVYDSVGLEPGNFDRWYDELDTFLFERQPNDYGNMKSANQIIHTLFYVVNGAGARVEEIEMNVLQNIREKYNLSASVIITNCDIAKEHELIAIENKVGKHGLSSFRVCSISEKTRGGDKIDKFGKEPAIKQILSASYEKVGKELTTKVLREVISDINKKKRKLKTIIDESDLSIFNLDAINNIDFDKILDIDWEYEDFIPLEYKNYHDFLENFNINYQGRDIINETFDSLDNVFDDLDDSNIKILKKIEKLESDFEHGGFWDKVGVVFQGLGIALTLKKTLKESIDEIFDLAVHEIYQLIFKVESKND